MADDNADKNPQGMGAQLQQLWSKMPRGRRIALVAAGVATLGIVGYLALRNAEPRYAAVATGLSPEDAGEVVASLQAQNIPYRLQAGGSIVEVPADRVDQVKLDLVRGGQLRAGGPGYELFDQQSFGTTSFVEEINGIRALQGELSRTIGAMDFVSAARVHIAPGRRSVFREADEPPSASVTLRLRRGHTAGGADVRGIVALVARAVPGLDPEKVVVIDESGKILSAGDDGTALTDVQTKLEQSLRKRVSDMLERAVGPGAAEVVVTVEMDQKQVNETAELYDQDKAALRSESRLVEGATDVGTVGGLAGARGNLPGAPAPQEGGAGQDAKRLSETRNFEISKVVRHTAGPKSSIKRVHVAILVDHKTEPAATEGAAPTVVPRTEEELQTLAAIASNAAGLDTARGDRIEIRSVEFFKPELPELPPAAPAASGLPLPLPLPILAAIAGGVLLLLIIVIFLLLRRSRRKRDRALRGEVMTLPAKVSAVEAALSSPNPEAAMRALAEGREELPGLPGPSIHERVVSSVRNDTQQAARVLAQWLSEPGKG